MEELLRDEETPAVEAAADTAQVEIERLRLALAESELRYLRLHADMDNLRKRLARERDEVWANAVGDCLGHLLPVTESLERAVGLMPDTAWKQGVQMVGRQLDDALARIGLEPISVDGDFDPQFHEAIALDTDSSAPENTITAVLERGYKFRGKVIRPSKVRVSTGGNHNE